jgi:biopolymer transport protein ExbB
MIQILLTSLLLTVAQASATPLDDETGTTTPAAATASQDSDSADAADPAPATDGDDKSESASPEDAGEESDAGAEPKPTAVSKLIGTLDEITQSGAIGLLRQGGWFMWPILLMGIVAAGVIIERYRSLKMLSTDSGELRSQVQELLNADKVEEALQLCHGEQGPVPAILSSGLRKFLVLRRLNYDAGRIEEQVVKSMDDYSVHVVAALERHLPVLATVSSVAPMLGFLGTVSGMITSFQDIVAQMGETNIVEAAAGGISEALLTTCFGLIIGIPAFIAFNYFTSVINRFVLEVEESATELIESVTLQLALGERSTNDGQVRATAETTETSSVGGE